MVLVAAEILGSVMNLDLIDGTFTTAVLDTYLTYNEMFKYL